MYRYEFEMKLLSDATFGSGESKNGIINTEVLRDSHGFPYLHGKTFKGFLRDSYKKYLEPIISEKDKTFYENIFGFAGYRSEAESYNKNCDGSVKFGNLELPSLLKNDLKTLVSIGIKEKNQDKSDEQIKALVKKELKRFIEIHLLDSVSSTMIGENGVAEDKSLRITRIIKRGLTFEGYIESNKKLEKAELENLKRLLKSLREVGVHKSRGKGVVLVKLKNDEPKSPHKLKDLNNNANNNSEPNYIFYEFILDEPVKIGASTSQYDYEETKPYITGSAVRGYFLNKLLSNNSNKFKKDLLKNTYFYNCYPIKTLDVSSKEPLKFYSFPTPNIFYTKKDTLKDSNIKEYNEGFINGEFINKYDYDNDLRYKRFENPWVHTLKKGDFSFFLTDEHINASGDSSSSERSKLVSFAPKIINKIHHTKQENFENIYRYEALKKGQKFYGIIDFTNVSGDPKKEIHKQLKSVLNERVLHLGGSRNSGYGKVSIEEFESIENLNSKLNFLESNTDSKTNESIVYFLSDTILKDKSNCVTTDLFNYRGFDFKDSTNELNEDKYLKLEEVKNNTKYSLDKTISKGFNAKWQSVIPSCASIKNGSSMLIPSTKPFDMLIDNKNINDLTLIGDRKMDGFGSVLINPAFLNVKTIQSYDEFKAKYSKCILNQLNFDHYKRNEHSQDNNLTDDISVNALIDNYMKFKIEETIAEIIDNAMKKSVVNKSNFDSFINNTNASKTQLNNILNEINHALSLEISRDEQFSLDSKEKTTHIASAYLKKIIGAERKLTRNYDRANIKNELLDYEIFDGFKIKDLENLNTLDFISDLKDFFNISEVIKESGFITKYALTNYKIKIAKEMLYYKIKLMD